MIFYVFDTALTVTIICESPRVAECSAERSGLPRRDLLVGGVALLAVWPTRGHSEQRAAASAIPSMPNPEFGPAARRGALCSTSNATGTGLRGEYFARAMPGIELLLTRTDLTVDFDSDFEWPLTHKNRRPQSVRWTGWIKPLFTGPYKFHVDHPGASLVVAQQAMLSSGTASAVTSIQLAAGRFYPITLQFSGIAAMSGRFRLEWTSPHGARYLVPRALMFLPSESVAPKR